MLQIIKKLESLNRINDKAEKYTLIIDEKLVEHGVLFFIPMEKFTVKVFIPAPFHEHILKTLPLSYRQVLFHKEAMLLK